MKVFTKKHGEHNMLCYSYDVSKDMSFCFHLLSEVGEPWQLSARMLRDELAWKRGCVVQTVELDKRPWLIEVLVKENAMLRTRSKV